MQSEPATPAEEYAIPIPPDFPVAWQDPDDERLFWTFDRVHWPDAMPPLVFAVAGEALAEGLTRAAHAYEQPVERVRVLSINTYRYQASLPLVELPAEAAERAERSYEKVRAAMGVLRETWTGEWLPEIKAHLAFWEAFDLPGASMPALLAHFDDTLARASRLWEIHFLLATAVYAAIGQFGKYYRELFGGQHALSAYRLLGGFHNMTLETGEALWKLSKRVLAEPQVLRVVKELPAEEVVTALESIPEGRSFLVEMQAYLEEYGQRADQVSIDRPSWLEDPAPVITNLKGYLKEPERNVLAEWATMAAERERLVSEARDALDGYPQIVRDEFEFLLKAAQVANILSEDHGFWIDYRSLYRMRRVFLELGRRFAEAGAIDRPEDIFYLAPEEIRQQARALPARGLRDLVSGRRAEVERFSQVIPPPTLGTRPARMPSHDALGRAWGNFAGRAPGSPGEMGIIKGLGSSAGVARGTARILCSLAEAGKIMPGDILVAPVPAPTWTPLFRIVAAVVTDSGGLLSHSAVTAREYGIPAVVGTCVATEMIKDGQLIEVDGSTGLVRVIESQDPSPPAPSPLRGERG